MGPGSATGAAFPAMVRPQAPQGWGRGRCVMGGDSGCASLPRMQGWLKTAPGAQGTPTASPNWGVGLWPQVLAPIREEPWAGTLDTQAGWVPGPGAELGTGGSVILSLFCFVSFFHASIFIPSFWEPYLYSDLKIKASYIICQASEKCECLHLLFKKQDKRANN